MRADLLYQNASDVRQNWSVTIDSVVHDRPAFIHRTHDYVAMLDAKLLAEAFKDYKFHITMEDEKDGSLTGYVEELHLVENAPDEETCISKIVAAMKDYALDYYTEFNYWSKAPNSAPHIPYVLKLLVCDDAMIRGDLVCQGGKN